MVIKTWVENSRSVGLVCTTSCPHTDFTGVFAGCVQVTPSGIWAAVNRVVVCQGARYRCASSGQIGRYGGGSETINGRQAFAGLVGCANLSKGVGDRRGW